MLLHTNISNTPSLLLRPSEEFVMINECCYEAETTDTVAVCLHTFGQTEYVESGEEKVQNNECESERERGDSQREGGGRRGELA